MFISMLAHIKLLYKRYLFWGWSVPLLNYCLKPKCISIILTDDIFTFALTLHLMTTTVVRLNSYRNTGSGFNSISPENISFL
jgi:hypothetical protein